MREEKEKQVNGFNMEQPFFSFFSSSDDYTKRICDAHLRVVINYIKATQPVKYQ